MLPILTAIAVDLSGIQFNILNKSRGPAVHVSVDRQVSKHRIAYLTFVVQGPRAQIDRKIYKRHMQQILKEYPNLTILSGSVHDLIIKKGAITSDINTGDIGAEVGGVTLGLYRMPFNLSLYKRTNIIIQKTEIALPHRKL